MLRSVVLPASGRLGRLIDDYQRRHSANLSGLADRIGISRQALRQWRVGELRALPTQANLASAAAEIDRPYIEVLAAALCDAGYLGADDSSAAARLLSAAILGQFSESVSEAGQLVSASPATAMVDLHSPGNDYADLAHYPWVVWTVALLDPDRLAGENVPERTAAAAAAAADLYGCVYEYCVDEDTMADGTPYYRWYIGVTQAQHQIRVGNIPVVVAELVGAIMATLPPEVDINEHWTGGPDAHATRVRNEVDHGYPGRG
jgi:hypothetical protein